MIIQYLYDQHYRRVSIQTGRNCLPRILALKIFGDVQAYQKVRDQISDFLIDNLTKRIEAEKAAGTYADYMNEKNTKIFEQLESIKKDTYWFKESDLEVAVSLYNLQIIVYSYKHQDKRNFDLMYKGEGYDATKCETLYLHQSRCIVKCGKSTRLKVRDVYGLIASPNQQKGYKDAGIELVNISENREMMKKVYFLTRDQIDFGKTNLKLVYQRYQNLDLPPSALDIGEVNPDQVDPNDPITPDDFLKVIEKNLNENSSNDNVS